MTDPNDPNTTPRIIEIGGKRRWRGLISYAMVFLAVATVFGWLLARFTRSPVLAVTLVTFLCGYMLIMGYLASRHRRH